MLKHATAPARFFSQVPNEIIRHSRLSSDAVRLLTWQLSLPDGANEPLSRTARRAGIGKTAFQRAKRQLLDEGYLHEWRRQGERGHWRTVQLVSNVPLAAGEAGALWEDGCRAAPEPVRTEATRAVPPPAATPPAAGVPTGRAVGRQPRTNTGEHTPNPPGTAPSVAPGAAPDAPRLADAEALLRSLSAAEPRLVMPARTARNWAPLAAEWLVRNLSPEHIRHTLTHGLDKARTPLGVLRWRLEHAVPDTPPEAVAPAPPEPRVSRMRECAGPHTQPRLFVPPSADQRLCPGCRHDTTLPPAQAPAPPGPGLLAFRTARAATKTTSLA